jgi:hypothetical protein
MSAPLILLVVAVLLVIAGVLCIRSARRQRRSAWLSDGDGEGYLMLGAVLLFVGFVFLLLSIVRGLST